MLGHPLISWCRFILQESAVRLSMQHKPNVQLPDVLNPSFVPCEDVQVVPDVEFVHGDVEHSHACCHSECVPGLGGDTICVWDECDSAVLTPTDPSLVVVVSGPFNTKASEIISWDSRGDSVPSPTSHYPPPCPPSRVHAWRAESPPPLAPQHE